MQTAIDKIRELRALHEDGLLSREEFDRRKNAILDAAHAPVTPVVTAPARGTELGLMAGQQVGPANRRYRLERLIALGGMGQVWQATDLATHAELGHSAQVALKILSPELTESAGHAKLLVQEATRARRLAHEHIVRVYDWAQDPATASYFVIMECLEGEDLESLLAREGALPLARTLDLLRPVAEALDYAWERHRLVHRDIKPGNVFVTARGEVKLLDFGIAARARAGGRSALDAPALSGTPGYRAPEAGAPDLVPSRALDVYAVATMVQQMVSGSATPAVGTPARPDGLRDDQWQALREGMAQDPAGRPESVSQLLDRLGATVEAPVETPAAAEEVALPPAAPAPDPAPAVTDPAAQQAAEAAQARSAAAALAARQQLREQQKRERAEAEVARRARRETLREQLAARRDEEAARARQAQEEAQRKALQLKAAAAYLAEQERAKAQQAAPVQAAAPVPAEPPTLLRDRFIDGAGAGPELVVLRAGRFQMGSPDHERKIAMASGAQKNWLARETPQHWVGIARPFAIGRYPVTVGEWRAFAEASGWQPQGDVDWAAPGFAQTEKHPVVGVSWHDAQAYLAWLGERTGQRYRLPSEAEWEYACRAGTRTAFSFGDAIDTTLANYDGNFTWNGGPRGEYRRGTTPVDQFAPNPWGLHDMHGNVWEWVQDVMHDSYEGAPVDGSAWESGGERARRILRGGSWLYNPRYLRAALRNGFSAVMSNDIVGFRVVRELPEDAAELDLS
ncbi:MULTISPECIES: SUMF1/EgtB/PvdO family nonheme iron enzyme [unclassified Massilia]|uniref:SUMF1/EgtB/PvdO family nonheme iron enzyme n=1 Tax=unclassified Massilia TaxID=2609279 RepID=UPI00177D6E0C|nr:MULTISPECIES: SUMF1/EgtB/PvdO family nonheme iron enzyme [unclassified Massilia]MBD8532346.1 SUMF1/EgtB/PvdO family nonheme iron enzyme [Massilia sp. CFBP 13647]MBD8673781.1 SUMF1/EgtB/PvdO family nonheme iron enzyme [Massilia sp. CFBP 13721]